MEAGNPLVQPAVESIHVLDVQRAFDTHACRQIDRLMADARFLDPDTDEVLEIRGPEGLAWTIERAPCGNPLAVTAPDGPSPATPTPTPSFPTALPPTPTAPGAPAATGTTPKAGCSRLRKRKIKYIKPLA